MIKPEINKIPDYHYDQYKEPCRECGTTLHEDICIEVYQNKTNSLDSFVVCWDCHQDFDEEYKSEGYIGQGELDEIWFNETLKKSEDQ